MLREDLSAGQTVHVGLDRHRNAYKVDHPQPVNRDGERAKGGRYVRLYQLDDEGNRRMYHATYKASELRSHGEWQRYWHDQDAEKAAEFGDGVKAREAEAIRLFFKGMGLPDNAVNVQTYTTLNGNVLVTGWSVFSHRIKWDVLFKELGVIAPTDEGK
jgi:hypothetical protein